MTTQTSTCTSDLVFRVRSGSENGKTINVSTQKCLLKPGKGAGAIAIYRGPEGVYATNRGGQTEINGQPLESSVLNSGDVLTFQRTAVEVVQLGTVSTSSTGCAGSCETESCTTGDCTTNRCTTQSTDVESSTQLAATPTNQTTGIESAQGTPEWESRMESLDQRLTEQSKHTSDQFNSINEQIGSLSNSVHSLINTLQTNPTSLPSTESFTEGSSEVSSESGFAAMPEPAVETVERSFATEAVAQPVESAVEETTQEDAIAENTASEMSTGFDAQFNELFEQTTVESTVSETTGQSEETTDSVSTEPTATEAGTTEPESEIRDNLNDMLAQLDQNTETGNTGVTGETQTETESESMSTGYSEAAFADAFGSTGTSESMETEPESTGMETTTPSGEATAGQEPETSPELESILAKFGSSDSSEETSLETTPQESTDPAVEEPKSEGVAEILARMQAEGKLQEESTSFLADSNEDGETEVTTSEPAFTPEAATQPESPAAAEATPADGADADSSVEDYMNRLLGRSGSDAPTTTSTGTTSSPTEDTAAPAPVKVQPVQLLSPDEFIPQQTAPERGVNLDAMRALANQQQNANVSRSANTKRLKGLSITSFAMMGLGLALGLYTLTLSSGLTSMPFLAAVGAFSVAAYFGYRGYIMLQQATQRPTPEAQSFAAAGEAPVEAIAAMPEEAQV